MASCIISNCDMLCSISNLSCLWPVRIFTFSRLTSLVMLVFIISIEEIITVDYLIANSSCTKFASYIYFFKYFHRQIKFFNSFLEFLDLSINRNFYGFLVQSSTFPGAVAVNYIVVYCIHLCMVPLKSELF